MNADFSLLYVNDVFTGLPATSSLSTTITSLAKELHSLGKPRTDLDLLLELFPEDDYFLELFEVMSVNIDNSLYAHLHMPPFKLHYPEPFIASPSFVHEELWFIHILHYQH